MSAYMVSGLDIKTIQDAKNNNNKTCTWIVIKNIKHWNIKPSVNHNTKLSVLVEVALKVYE